MSREKVPLTPTDAVTISERVKLNNYSRGLLRSFRYPQNKCRHLKTWPLCIIILIFTNIINQHYNLQTNFPGILKASSLISHNSKNDFLVSLVVNQTEGAFGSVLQTFRLQDKCGNLVCGTDDNVNKSSFFTSPGNHPTIGTFLAHSFLFFFFFVTLFFSSNNHDNQMNKKRENNK
jgi:hypothetical protein